MTKFFIATIIGCGLLVPSQSMATTPSAKKEINKSASINSANKDVAKAVKKPISKKAVKSVSKKTVSKSKKAPPRKVVSLDFSKPEKKAVSFENSQVIKSGLKKKKLLAKAEASSSAEKAAAVKAMSENRGPASVAPSKKVVVVKAVLPKNRKPASTEPMSLAQLKKSTKPYWSAYCKDGIVLNSHVYCALKNPQKLGKAGKATKLAGGKDLKAKKLK